MPADLHPVTTSFQTRAATDELHRVADELPPVSLAEVNAAAALQTRVDRKYLVTAAQLRWLGKALRDRFRCLEINGSRVLGYDSEYFDSPSLQFFRAHRQGRRRRVKVRVRTYLDSGARFVEVKTKSGRGATIKTRIPYDGGTDRLDAEAAAFVRDLVVRECGTCPRLDPVLNSRYRRSTFVDVTGGSRLTCDVDLRWTAGDVCAAGPDKILLESKTAGHGRVDELLSERGIRPIGMSKYALGTALVHPDLSANRWHRLLEREFRPAAGPVYR